MAKTGMKTRKEVIEKQREQYKRASKKRKGAILDGVCLSTGLSRDRAKKLLAGTPPKEGGPKAGRGRKPIYGEAEKAALEKVWALMNFASGKRLAAGMGDMLGALLRFGETDIAENTEALLRRMSPATMDRLLARAKERLRFRGISTTKPGTLLKKGIPIRLGDEWDENTPGFVEIDLVAHCGETTAGEYINTLDVTDIKTGWTETQATLNKAQSRVFAALNDIEGRLPFPLLGIDSDNGGEFINHELYRYCKTNGICFTRSRPYRKNDNCHVEQKNWHVVRKNIGYGRYEGEAALDALNRFHALLRLYTNFFEPQTKLIAKRRDGANVRKTYEKPLTPYRRALAEPGIPDETKAALTETFLSLNPAELKRGMIKLLDALDRMRVS